MHPIKLFSLFAFLSGSSNVFAKTDKEPAVVQISKTNFNELIDSKDPVLVEFFAPWCGHCKKLAPEFETAASTLKDQNIKLAAVDCTTEKEICDKLSIKGYPTLAVFRSGAEVTKYQGPREAAAIVKFMKKQAAPTVTSIKTSEELNKFRESDDVVIVGFFKDEKSEAAINYAHVAEKMRAEQSFAAMSNIPAHYKDGQVVLFKKFDELEASFTESSFTVESLTKFIARESFPLTAEIGPENYAKYVDSGIPMAYFFYADEKQKEQFTSVLNAAAKTVKGKVHAVFINGALYGQHAEVLNLAQEWPAFAIHDMATDTKYPLPKGEKITVDSLSKHLEAFVSGNLKPNFKSQPIPKDEPSDSVVTLVHDNFDQIAMDKSKDVLVEIYAPWCGACKRVAPKYEQLAKDVAALAKDKFVLAKFDGTANDLPLSINFRLEHFPTFKLIKSGSNEVVSFKGRLSYYGLAEFLQQNAGHKITFEPNPLSDDLDTPDHDHDLEDDSDEAEHMDL